MQVRIAVLADFASISEGNKLNILGIFTNIFAKKTPAVQPQMQLVTMFEFDGTETGDRNLKIVLVDEDGGEIFSISGVMSIERGPAGRSTLLHQILNFNNMVFPKFGGYEFKILLDGNIVSNIPLNVLEVPVENQ